MKHKTFSQSECKYYRGVLLEKKYLPVLFYCNFFSSIPDEPFNADPEKKIIFHFIKELVGIDAASVLFVKSEKRTEIVLTYVMHRYMYFNLVSTYYLDSCPLCLYPSIFSLGQYCYFKKIDYFLILCNKHSLWSCCAYLISKSANRLKINMYA